MTSMEIILSVFAVIGVVVSIWRTIKADAWQARLYSDLTAKHDAVRITLDLERDLKL